MAPFAGKGKQILVIAGTAFYTGKTVMKNSAIKILVYYLRYNWSKVSVFCLVFSLIDPLKYFIVIFYALIIWAVLGFSALVLKIYYSRLK